MNNRAPITWQELAYLIPLVGGIVTIAFFLATISTKLDSVQGQVTDTKSQIMQLNDTVDAIKTVQGTQGQDIAVIKQILQHNNLTKATSPLLPTALTFAPPPTSGQSATITQPPIEHITTTTNTIIMQPTVVPAASMAPTTTPQPGNPTPMPILCVTTLIHLCI